MRYFGKILRPEYTDLAVVVGPSVRWTEDDYEDLARETTALLGYRVLLTTADRADRDLLHRKPPAKVVMLEGLQTETQTHHFLNAVRLVRWMSDMYGTQIEWWHVHRRRGIYRVA